MNTNWRSPENQCPRPMFVQNADHIRCRLSEEDWKNLPPALALYSAYNHVAARGAPYAGNGQPPALTFPLNRPRKDAYTKSKARFESKPKLPPIPEKCSLQNGNPPQKRLQGGGKRVGKETSFKKSTNTFGKRGTARRAFERNNNVELKPWETVGSGGDEPPTSPLDADYSPPASSKAQIKFDSIFMHEQNANFRKHQNGFPANSQPSADERKRGRASAYVDENEVELSPADVKRKKRKNRKMCMCICIVVTLVVLGMAVSAVAIWLTAKTDTVTTNNTTKIVQYSVILKLQDAAYNESLANPYSSYYIALESEICNVFFIIMRITLMQLKQCEIADFREGSVLAESTLTFNYHTAETLTEEAIRDHISVWLSTNHSGLDPAVKAFISAYSPDTGHVLVTQLETSSAYTSSTFNSTTSAPVSSVGHSTTDRSGVLSTLLTSTTRSPTEGAGNRSAVTEAPSSSTAEARLPTTKTQITLPPPTAAPSVDHSPSSPELSTGATSSEGKSTLAPTTRLSSSEATSPRESTSQSSTVVALSSTRQTTTDPPLSTSGPSTSQRVRSLPSTAAHTEEYSTSAEEHSSTVLPTPAPDIGLQTEYTKTSTTEVPADTRPVTHWQDQSTETLSEPRTTTPAQRITSQATEQLPDTTTPDTRQNYTQAPGDTVSAAEALSNATTETLYSPNTTQPSRAPTLEPMSMTQGDHTQVPTRLPNSQEPANQTLSTQGISKPTNTTTAPSESPEQVLKTTVQYTVKNYTDAATIPSTMLGVTEKSTAGQDEHQPTMTSEEQVTRSLTELPPSTGTATPVYTTEAPPVLLTTAALPTERYSTSEIPVSQGETAGATPSWESTGPTAPITQGETEAPTELPFTVTQPNNSQNQGNNSTTNYTGEVTELPYTTIPASQDISTKTPVHELLPSPASVTQSTSAQVRTELPVTVAPATQERSSQTPAEIPSSASTPATQEQTTEAPIELPDTSDPEKQGPSSNVTAGLPTSVTPASRPGTTQASTQLLLTTAPDQRTNSAETALGVPLTTVPAAQVQSTAAQTELPSTATTASQTLAAIHESSTHFVSNNITESEDTDASTVSTGSTPERRTRPATTEPSTVTPLAKASISDTHYSNLPPTKRNDLTVTGTKQSKKTPTVLSSSVAATTRTTAKTHSTLPQASSQVTKTQTNETRETSGLSTLAPSSDTAPTDRLTTEALTDANVSSASNDSAADLTSEKPSTEVNLTTVSSNETLSPSPEIGDTTKHAQSSSASTETGRTTSQVASENLLTTIHSSEAIPTDANAPETTLHRKAPTQSPDLIKDLSTTPPTNSSGESRNGENPTNTEATSSRAPLPDD